MNWKWGKSIGSLTLQRAQKFYTHCYYKSTHSEFAQIRDIYLKVRQLLKIRPFQFPHIRHPVRQAEIELGAPLFSGESARRIPSSFRIHFGHPLERGPFPLNSPQRAYARQKTPLRFRPITEHYLNSETHYSTMRTSCRSWSLKLISQEPKHTIPPLSTDKRPSFQP